MCPEMCDEGSVAETGELGELGRTGQHQDSTTRTCETQTSRSLGPTPSRTSAEAFKHSGQIRRAPVYTAQGREVPRQTS